MCITYMHIYKLCTSCSKGQPFTANDNYLFYYPCHINRESCDALCMFMCVCMHTQTYTHKNQSQQQAKYCLLLSKTRRNVNEGIFVITLCSALCLSLLLFVELGRTSASNTYIVNVRMKDHVSQTRATSNLLELKWSHYTGYNTDSCI